jgi:hypothetical protein
MNGRIPASVGMAAMALAVGAIGAAPTFAATSAQPSAHGHAHVTGSWVDDVPCVPTKTRLDPVDSTSLLGSCTGSSVWVGHFDGVTHYTTHGYTNLLSGDGRARITETFIGIDTATHQTGTMRLKGTVVQNGETLRMVVKERVVGGTGAFAHQRGRLRYAGVDTSLVGGAGHYNGRLRQA